MPEGLLGRRILVLRPAEQAEDLALALVAEGAEPVVVPAIRILPAIDPSAIADALAREHDWVVFTSVNGVAALPRDPPTAMRRSRIASVGPATAQALEGLGFSIDFIPTAYTTVALAAELPGPPGRVCVVRAEAAGPELETILSGRGFTVERVDAYRTEPAGAGPIAQALAVGVDAVALTSASITWAFADAVTGTGPGAAVFSIGPATTAACRAAGLAVAGEAQTHTIPGLVAAMVGGLGPGTSAGHPATMSDR